MKRVRHARVSPSKALRAPCAGIRLQRLGILGPMYNPKKSWMWGRAFRTYALTEFAPGFRLAVPAAYTGEGIAHEDEQGALRLANGQQIGRVDRTTGEVLIGRKLQEGDLPGKPRA